MMITVDSLDGLHQVTDAIEASIDKGFQVILLHGDLGAGKTTLVKALCQEWGVMEPVSSPTFSLVQEYRSPGKGTLYHLDLYRLDKDRDLEQIGLDEYLHSGCICMIEWPEIANAYFTMPHIDVAITLEKDNIRKFKITTHDAMDT